MEITFKVDRVVAEQAGYAYGSQLNLTVDASGRDIAEQLDLDDRLYDLDPSDILLEVPAEKMLEAIGEEDVRKWLLANSDPDDTLEAIGEEKISEFMSHAGSDNNLPA
ncbi:hypothetical protein [Stutzerimonas stutzeri]|uniref:hypothetical protein n=1 Tax=Stutzerimonas stutzeri TaxID=316 RepID=UPI00371244A5